MRSKLVLAFMMLLSCAAVAQDGVQQVADMGTCKLENGQSIQGCKIGYRTYGKLAADKKNVVVLTSWFLGNAAQAASAYVGPQKILDPAKFYVIAIDALGDGQSSSPSNSEQQPRMHFPQFTIRDMVQTQHRLVTEKFGLQHVHAVVGASMGGMQALQWAYSYPEFMDRVAALVPSPRLTAYDLLLWRAELNAITSDVEWRGGDYTGRPMMKAMSDIQWLHAETADKVVRTVAPADFQKQAESREQGYSFDPNDQIRQLQAMMSQDVAPGKTVDEMAKMLKPPTMFVVGLHDTMVFPAPAIALAKAAKQPLMELDSECGHLSLGCEMSKVAPAVREFLEK